ncbi:hypothetical protein LTR86_008359 [Recurvomyces mirabilis]|nr:hypothetical protein LTR86_008359 [Recurvomyces mirabilis]
MPDLFSIMRIAFMSSETAECRVRGLPKLHEVFDDHVEAWVPYPLDDTTVPSRPTLYLRERCKLTLHLEKMHALILAPNTMRERSIEDFVSAVDSLRAQMEQWYEHMPLELYYIWPMTVAVLELHASYLASVMILLTVARARLLRPDHVSASQPMHAEQPDAEVNSRWSRAEDMLSRAISLAQKAAGLLGDFRKRYGLKISPA